MTFEMRRDDMTLYHHRSHCSDACTVFTVRDPSEPTNVCEWHTAESWPLIVQHVDCGQNFFDKLVKVLCVIQLTPIQEWSFACGTNLVLFCQVHAPR